MRTLAILAAALLAAPAAAENSDTQLDGWAGTWAISDVAGTPIGRSTIVEQAPRLMLFEQRQIDGFAEPQPLWFAFSERSKGWTQLFRGPFGLREFVPASPPGEWPLVLAADDVALADGSTVSFRMTTTRLTTDSYRRVLLRTRDKGATWETVFDYHYARQR